MPRDVNSAVAKKPPLKKKPAGQQLGLTWSEAAALKQITSPRGEVKLTATAVCKPELTKIVAKVFGVTVTDVTEVYRYNKKFQVRGPVLLKLPGY